MYRLGELFCGPGGIACGSKLANIGDPEYQIVHEWANDYDEETCATYIHNICPDNPKSVICGDVRKLDIAGLKKIDALAFGFPCNDFSIVGEQKGFEGTYGPLYKYGVKVLETFQPDWFLAENVSGLASANAGKALNIVLNDMAHAGDEGYDIFPHLYKFEEYGIPQARHRIIIVGIRKDLKRVFNPPSTERYKEVDNSCKKAIEYPPIPENAFNNEQTRISERVRRRLECIKPGENAWTADIPDELKLNVKTTTLSQIYKRLSPDKPAYTVTGSGGGGTHIYHYDEPRPLTNRERARLQTFPDSYHFMGSKESVRRQIGMAVPVEGARIIFEAILKTMKGVPYKAVKCNIPFSNEPAIRLEFD